VPRDKPSCWPALSLDRVSTSCAGGPKPARISTIEGRKRPQPPGARPAEYRRPAWRPGRFLHLSDGSIRTRENLPAGAQSTPPPPSSSMEGSHSAQGAPAVFRSVVHSPRSRPVAAGREPSRPAAACRGRGRPRSNAQPPYFPSLRRSFHFGSRSAPSRAASLAWLAATSAEACSLDRALCRLPLLRAGSERPLRARSTLPALTTSNL
jgi:hypothetical protein